MNLLNPSKKLAVISALTEGCSIRSIVRLTGMHKKTIMMLLIEVGSRCKQMAGVGKWCQKPFVPRLR